MDRPRQGPGGAERDPSGRPTSGDRYRAVFISDLHLGSRRSQAERLLSFLRRVECEFLYLVGDVADSWGPERMAGWPRTHLHVLEELRIKATGGTRVLCLPGNHDLHFHREWTSLQPHLRVADEHEHTTADGRRLLVVHGDEFDVVVRRWIWIGRLGDGVAFTIERLLGLLDRALPSTHQGVLSRLLKRCIKHGIGYVASFQRTAIERTRGRYDGIVCGHVHVPAVFEVGGVHYHNDGDWVESCTALVEHLDGRLELLHCRRALP